MKNNKKSFFYFTVIGAIGVYFLIMLLPSYVVYRGKEYFNTDEIVKYQLKNETIVGFGYKENTEYKIRYYLSNYKPVIALGTSRVMQFKKEFFKKEVFYNLGGVVSRIKDFNKFIDVIPRGKEPKIIIISLDQYFFNYNFDNVKESTNYNFLDSREEKIDFSFNIKNVREIYLDVLYTKKIDLKKLEKSTRIGVNAIFFKNGFLNDGSYYYGKIADENPALEEKLEDSLTRIKEKNRRFEIGKEINKKAVEELEKFLIKCKARNIEVIGFLPPYSDIILDEMKKESGNYAYVFDLYDELKDVFSENEYNLFDFTSLKTFNGKQNEIIDGFHGSDVAYLRLFIEINKRNKKIREFSKEEELLKNDLKNRKSDLEVY